MKLEDQDLILIEGHLDGSLPSKEKKDLEDRLKNDTAFHALYHKTAAGIKAVRTFTEQSSMQMLHKIYTEEKANGQLENGGKIRRIGSGRRWLALAASIALLLTIGYSLLPNSNGQQNLYSSYFETPTFDLLRSGGTSEMGNIAQLYNSANYQAALESLEEFELNQGSTFETKYYKALSLNELDRTAEALVLLDQLSSQNEKVDDVLWTKGLFQIKLGQTTEAKNTLEGLLNGDVAITPARRAKITEILKLI